MFVDDSYNNNEIYVVSGGFDPITDAHAEFISGLNRPVVVLLNSDGWLKKKKGAAFLPWEVRSNILRCLKNVDMVLPVLDTDGTVTKTLQFLAMSKPSFKFIFVNSGDRREDNTPEFEALADGSVKNLAFDWIESTKPQSHSSEYLNAWIREWMLDSANKEAMHRLYADQRVPQLPNNGGPMFAKRDWGFWVVLSSDEYRKEKLLVVNPGKSLSMQRHRDRTEVWNVLSGQGLVDQGEKTIQLVSGYRITIPKFSWHRLEAYGNQPMIVHEIQTSEKKNGCSEMDIERSR
jgi:mannose-6-phosphate isomerase-like protein (cupin superfamily)